MLDFCRAIVYNETVHPNRRPQKGGHTVHYTVKMVLRKLIVGVLALALAAAITLFIKENLDVKDPETALPSIQVATEGVVLSPEMVFRAGYEWNFFTSTEINTPIWTTADILSHTYPVDVPPRAKLDIDFSLQADTLKISRSDQEDFSAFVTLADDFPNSLLAPAEAGQYLYKIEAGFGRRGSIIYYLLLNVKETVSPAA